MKSSDDKELKGHKLAVQHAFLASRFGIIALVAIVLAIGSIECLLRTTVVHVDDYRKMGDSTFKSRKVIFPERGDILASDGSILATNLYYYNVRLDLRTERFKIVEFDSLMPNICDSLALFYPHRTRAEWEEHLRRGISVPIESRSRGWSIVKNVNQETAQLIKQISFFKHNPNSAYTGLVIEPSKVRSYPFGEMAKLSIGHVGQMTEDPRIKGRSGLEAALDSLLSGVPGVKRPKLGTRGIYQSVDTPAVDGYDVHTTIDITIQDILESELGEMLLAAQADWGAAMIMEVQTGDIKALSNLERDSTSRTPKYIPALNRIVLGYEPGSVMKVMSMAVALRYGYAHLNRSYPIGASYAYLGRSPISDTHSPANLKVSQFMEYSSNIGMVKMSMPEYEHNVNLFRERLAEMGFFDRFNTGIERERRPVFHMLENNVRGRLDLSRMVFGYSTFIPPLYTCAFYNAIANNGRFVRPRLVKGLRSPEGVDSIIPCSYVRDSILSYEHAAELRRQMHDVVWNQGGTAKSLRNDVVEIAGKTGTSRIALERPKDWPKDVRWRGGYMEGHYRVTFCGFFPYENPRYTCIVVISDPKLPYRGPAVSSGKVLLNTALKMYARGMLDEDPEFIPQPNDSTIPLVHTSCNAQRRSEINSALGVGRVRTFSPPNTAYPAGQVPDVRGISLREALSILEAAGYSVEFIGSGYVDAQEPIAGTDAEPGSCIHLSLKNLN